MKTILWFQYETIENCMFGTTMYVEENDAWCYQNHDLINDGKTMALYQKLWKLKLWKTMKQYGKQDFFKYYFVRVSI